MTRTSGLTGYAPRPYPVVTIGNFDGLHRGHLALLRTVVETARAKRGTGIVLTFQPHPVTVLSPGADIRFLTSPDEKLSLLEHVGIDEIIFVPFDRAFASLTPEEFVSRILKDGVGTRELFVGEHFAFGKGRAGRIPDLRRLAATAGFQVHPVPPLTMDGEVVSSTRIRTLIQSGEVRRASHLLGRTYELGGTVVHGERRGQGLGWPTANLCLPPDRVIPADGVYATATRWKERRFESVSYIGTRPTFGPGERLLEVYLLDQQMDLYGQPIRVQFVERLRDDMLFESPEDLSARIDLDVTLARETLKTATQATTDVWR